MTGEKKTPAAKGKEISDDSYTLQKPLNLGDRTVDSVAIRALTGKDMLEIEHEIRAMRPEADYASIGQAERMMRLIGKSCGLIFEDVQQMGAKDVNALSLKVNAFL